MLKNKYIIGISIGAACLLIAGTGAAYQVLHSGSKPQAKLAASTAQDETTSSQPVTLSQDAVSGPQISAAAGKVGSSVAGGSSSVQSNSSSNASTSTDIAKILDPSTFAQYDKYKDAQTASFIDLQTGTGAAITANSQVTVVYKGWLTNGTMFDASKTGSDGKLQAFSFTEGQHQVISGWEAGLEGAKEGGVRFLIIPPVAGYGAAGQGPIPGNSVLVFQVQVVQVK